MTELPITHRRLIRFRYFSLQRLTKFKVWDEYGRPMYSSSPHDYPITAIAWDPDGNLFAVGSFNLLRLCDKAGVSPLETLMIIFRYFLMVDGALVQVYNYEGRMQCTLKQPAISAAGELISEKSAAISNDTTAIRDRIDPKSIHLFETITGKSAGSGKLTHTSKPETHVKYAIKKVLQNDVIKIAIDQCGPPSGRKVAFIDKSLDCYLALVKTYGISQRIAKIGAVVTNIHFNDQTNMLAGLQDNHLVVWLYPSSVFVDRDMLQKTIFEKDDIDLGKAPNLLTFVGNHVSARRSDGALIPCSITPFPAALCAHIAASRWDQAIRLCRHIKVEKVKFLSELRAEPSKDVRSAMMAAFTGNFKDADAMLVQNEQIFRAIMLNISIFRWQRQVSDKV
ncbi:unnamed protein product [Gongylonema pulchrum]|uniref:Clathrin heavy chain n=1 Tax=Gongylonema pulchrum TaxID=637853 RepID=A0A183E6F3_9BILA|nr:unnamed protein product [Gongylonema pulchrum]